MDTEIWKRLLDTVSADFGAKGSSQYFVQQPNVTRQKVTIVTSLLAGPEATEWWANKLKTNGDGLFSNASLFGY